MAANVLTIIVLAFIPLITHGASTGGQRDVLFECPTDRGYYPHDILCHAYYVCYQKEAYLSLCPPSELFDDDILQCAEESVVDCGKRNRPDIKPEETTTGGPSANTTTPSAGNSTANSTSSWAVTNSTQKPITKPTTTEDPDEEDVECPEADGLYPHPKDKQRYIHCQGWFAHLMKCPHTLVFDPILKVCAWPEVTRPPRKT